MSLKKALDVLHIQLRVAGSRILEVEKKSLKAAFVDYSVTGEKPDLEGYTTLSVFIFETAVAIYPKAPKKAPMSGAERQKRYRSNKAISTIEPDTEHFDSDTESIFDDNEECIHNRDANKDEEILLAKDGPGVFETLFPDHKPEAPITEEMMSTLEEFQNLIKAEYQRRTKDDLENSGVVTSEAILPELRARLGLDKSPSESNNPI